MKTLIAVAAQAKGESRAPQSLTGVEQEYYPVAPKSAAMKLLTAAESRQVDLLSQQKYGVPSFDLMTRAGEAVADEIVRGGPRRCSDAGCWSWPAKGNNGGDGMVAARRLKQVGVSVRALMLGSVDALKGDAARACAEFIALAGPVEAIDANSACAAHLRRAGNPDRRDLRHRAQRPVSKGSAAGGGAVRRAVRRRRWPSISRRESIPIPAR